MMYSTDFYTVQPAKFTNVTNGIASRRWLMQSNPLLNKFTVDHIGDGFLHDFSQLSRLKELENNDEVLRELGDIKYRNKLNFACYLNDERVWWSIPTPSSTFR